MQTLVASLHGWLSRKEDEGGVLCTEVLKLNWFLSFKFFFSCILLGRVRCFLCLMSAAIFYSAVKSMLVSLTKSFLFHSQRPSLELHLQSLGAQRREGMALYIYTLLGWQQAPEHVFNTQLNDRHNIAITYKTKQRAQYLNHPWLLPRCILSLRLSLRQCLNHLEQLLRLSFPLLAHLVAELIRMPSQSLPL